MIYCNFHAINLQMRNLNKDFMFIVGYHITRNGCDVDIITSIKTSIHNIIYILHAINLVMKENVI